LAETHILTVWQQCCFNLDATTAEKLLRLEVLVPVTITAALPLLPEKPRYPKLGAHPKYGDFTLAKPRKQG
jgi:hypothetical protein